jgi:predicted DNA-binding protein YlxM (UPF0122 family)
MKEQHERFSSTLKDWKLLEKQSAESIGQVKAKCGNPLVCLVMEIIENDAGMHERIQEFIVSSLERQPLDLSPNEIGEIVELIRNHIRIKAQMVEKTEEMLGLLKDKSLRVQEFLVKTLLEDERKHKEMLEGIEKVRSVLYPYWAH